MPKVKIASVGDALNAGFIPKGGNLENSKGVSVSAGQLQAAAGKTKDGQETGNKDYPFIIEGTIWPKELVFPQVAKNVEFKGGQFNVYADGSVESLSGVIYEPDFINFLEGADEAKAPTAK